MGWVDGEALEPAPTRDAGAGASGTHQGARMPRRHDGTVGGVHDQRTSSANGREVVVTADVLFVRNGPDPHAHILRRVHAGDRLSILGTLHGWDYVSQRDGSHGWVSTQ